MVTPTPTPAPPGNDADEYERFVVALETAGCEPKDDGEKGTARCPCADLHSRGDATPSLTFARGAKRTIVAKCHAGCSWDEIQKALELVPETPPLPAPDSTPLPDFAAPLWLLTVPDNVAYADAALFRLVRCLKASST